MKKYIMAVMVLFMVVLCGGCGKEEDAEAVNITFVLGMASGESKIKENLTEIQELSAMPESDVCFISAEGKPQCIGESIHIKDFSANGYTKTMIKRLRSEMQSSIEEMISSYEPSSTQIDMAAAIGLAVQNLNAHVSDGRNNILVLYSSGKSTSGIINMAETPLCKLDVEKSITVIAEKMKLDMSKIDEVIWYCCGACGGENQPELSPEEKARMEEFYNALFQELGLKKEITFKDELPSNEYYYYEEKPVSQMEVKETESGLQELTKSEQILNIPVILEEAQVQYEADTAEFKDRKQAEEAVKPVITYMQENPECKIVLYSTCAGDKDCDWLSTARSEQIKNLIETGGVDGERINILKIKIADDKYYQYNRGTGEGGGVNRKTVIVDANTEFGQRLLELAQE